MTQNIVLLLEEFEQWKAAQDYPEGTAIERFAQYREDRWNLTKYTAIETLIDSNYWDGDPDVILGIIRAEHGSPVVLSHIEDAEEAARLENPSSGGLASGGLVSDGTVDYVLKNL